MVKSIKSSMTSHTPSLIQPSITAIHTHAPDNIIHSTFTSPFLFAISARFIYLFISSPL